MSAQARASEMVDRVDRSGGALCEPERFGKEMMAYGMCARVGERMHGVAISVSQLMNKD
jgi:hypothetical protein